jgi:hypothetical protein
MMGLTDPLEAGARAAIAKMSPTDMRVLIEEIGTSSTTGMTTAQLKARLLKMARECDWMPKPLPDNAGNKPPQVGLD